MSKTKTQATTARFAHEVWNHLRPMLITIFALGMAYGTWQANNPRGTILFLCLAAFPPGLRLIFYALAGLRYLRAKSQEKAERREGTEGAEGQERTRSRG